MSEIVERRNGGELEHRNYALFSGGHDSLVNTHYAMQNGLADCVIHIDTGIGIPETKEYVKQRCDTNEWPLVVLTSDHSYEEIVKENGFPGPGVHIILYSKLKERALREIPRHIDEKPNFYTGVRASESSRRFKNVSPRQEDKQWVWLAPIWDWGEDDIREYIDKHGLVKSPVKQLYHHSGECLCGCFGNRTEELAVLEAHYPETAERIKELEKEVQEERGSEDKQSYWGHGGMSSIDLRALLADNDETQMMLCQSCEKAIEKTEDKNE
jgi:phosphoadenosine phosphosulfate reductase